MEVGAYEFARNLAREHAQVIRVSVYVGCVTGTIILLVCKGKSSHILRFNEELLFIYLIPPIIFNAGFQVKKKQFFKNFLTIMMFGVIGVFISILVFSFRFFNHHNSWHPSIREISVVVLMAYLPYMVAELFDLSGILTVFFCGILMSLYAWHNITESSRITTRHVSFIAETFIFLYVGMDALDIEKWKLTKLSLGDSLSINGTIIMLILIGRAAFVFPLSALSNFMNRRAERSASISFMVIIWWAGLMRGAVSIALAFKQSDCFSLVKFTYSGLTLDPVDATMITNTIIVILFSTLVFGFLTKPLITFLLPHTATSNIQRKVSKDISDHLNLPLLSFEESASTNISRAKDNLSTLIENPVHTIHSYWRRFDFGGPIRTSLHVK